MKSSSSSFLLSFFKVTTDSLSSPADNDEGTLYSREIPAWRRCTQPVWEMDPNGFNLDRLAIVEQNEQTNNLLVRSNIPLDENGEFVYQQILNKLNAELKLTGENKLTEYNTHFTVRTLLNRLGECTEWEQMKIACEKYQERYGTSISFEPAPVLGCISSPFQCLPEKVQGWYQRAFPYYSTWTHLPHQIEKVSQAHQQPREDSRIHIQLVHCIHGADRTGMFVANYKMYHGTPFQEARIEAQKFAKTKPGYNDIDVYTHNGINQFVAYLKSVGKSGNIGNTEWDYRHKNEMPPIDKRKKE
ncbi:hypothetical protein D5018_16850 [Parashewanella curva]|uniref:Tyrosine specific protein phosphatases domain-containing protein n=2 Tax=Parashewanella curva TaxID=2338552 RepID=A0A3L8PSZ8_9GAMM|nr:hypothetical protein D5018_16850 [Parashewanella curva]